MGKPRRKVSSAEVVARKKKKADGGDVSSNPFEVRVNRRKHDVLGQKMRSGRGLPGVARSRGVQKVSRAPHLSLSDSLCHCLLTSPSPTPSAIATEEEDSAAGVPLSAQDWSVSGQEVR